MFRVLLFRTRKDDDIVEVDKANLPSDARQDDVKRALRRGRCLFQPKRNLWMVERPQVRGKRRLVALLRHDWHLPEAGVAF